jgi:hypothetical protein
MGKIGKNSDRSINYVNAHGHGNAATTFFAHAHGVYMEPVAASTWIQLHIPLPRFLRLGTSRLSRKQRAMDPRCGTYRREGKDTEAAWDGYMPWRTPPPPYLRRRGCAQDER